MKFELLIFGITAFLIANTYYDGKYVAILKSWTKYYQMAMYAFLGLSLYLFIKKHPHQSKNLLNHANGIIKYMPIDKHSSDILTPFLDMTAKNFNRQESRVMQSGLNNYNLNAMPNAMPNEMPNAMPNARPSAMHGASNNKPKTKRSVSETKKKFVASQQNWRCGGCQEQLSAWFEVDHHVRLEHGGSNHVDNLVALCRECHGRKTAMENM